MHASKMNSALLCYTKRPTCVRVSVCLTGFQEGKDPLIAGECFLLFVVASPTSHFWERRPKLCSLFWCLCFLLSVGKGKTHLNVIGVGSGAGRKSVVVSACCYAFISGPWRVKAFHPCTLMSGRALPNPKLFEELTPSAPVEGSPLPPTAAVFNIVADECWSFIDIKECLKQNLYL